MKNCMQEHVKSKQQSFFPRTSVHFLVFKLSKYFSPRTDFPIGISIYIVGEKEDIGNISKLLK